MNADCAHLSEQPGLLGRSILMRPKVARGYTLQKGSMIRMCQDTCKSACPVSALGPRLKNNFTACLSYGPSTAIHPHARIWICAGGRAFRQTIIRRNRVELFLTVTFNQKRQPQAITRG